MYVFIFYFYLFFLNMMLLKIHDGDKMSHMYYTYDFGPVGLPYTAQRGGGGATVTAELT